MDLSSTFASPPGMRADFGQNLQTCPFTGADMLLYSAAVRHFGRGLSDEVLEALSWVFLNRRASGELQQASLLPEHASPDWRERQLADPIAPEDARVVAALARVLAGSVPDITCGATRFHCHHETPAWAECMDVRALIGPYLFYRARSSNSLDTAL
ncbi:MAG: hypothetical protein JKY63_05760 [Rhodobiaceae bacterium]|nr:hypothetical protein [Rhodobiaceae bacterium]